MHHSNHLHHLEQGSRSARLSPQSMTNTTSAKYMCALQHVQYTSMHYADSSSSSSSSMLVVKVKNAI